MQITIDSQSFVNLGQLMGSRVSVSTAIGGPPSSVGGAGNNDTLGNSFLSDGSQDSEGLRDFDQIFHPAGSTSSNWSHELGPHEEDAMDDANGNGDDEADQDDDDNNGVVDDDDDSVLPALPPRSPAPASPTGSALSSSPSNSSSSRPFKSTLAGFGDDLTTASSAGGSAIAVAGSIDDDFPDNQGEVIGALCLDPVAGGDASCQPKTVTGKIISAGRNHHPLHEDDRDSKKDMNNNNGSKQQPASSPCSAGEAGVFLGDDGSAAASPLSIHRESWLHIPLEGSEARPDDSISCSSNSGSVADDSAVDGPAEAKVKNAEQPSNQEQRTTATGGAAARRALAALSECGDRLACGMEKAVALATPTLQHLSRLVKLQVEAGVEACARGQQAAIKAVDNVPQAPGEWYILGFSIRRDHTCVRTYQLFFWYIFPSCPSI